MGVEIERKFLIAGAFEQTDGEFFRQGYLCAEPGRTVRIRVCGSKGYITIKGQNVGLVRAEFEYEIPHTEAAELLEMCERPLIEKTRYKIPHEGKTWEVDVFHGDNEGLTVAEIELETAGQAFAKPAWVGEEVTEDARYYNSSLVRHPYKSW